MARLDGKVAFITGAGSGIGRAAACLFAAEGAQVVIAELDEKLGRESEAILVCKHGIPHLIAAGGGSVINTASNVALMALPGRDCYTAAKGGVASMTRSLAAEYAAHRIRVNAVAPAATRTERVAAMAMGNQHIDALVKQGQLLGWCEPEHIAYMALYLASDESAVTTGQVLPVDSGATIF